MGFGGWDWEGGVVMAEREEQVKLLSTTHYMHFDRINTPSMQKLLDNGIRQQILKTGVPRAMQSNMLPQNIFFSSWKCFTKRCHGYVTSMKRS